jgi:pyruvate,water dikinase
MKPLVLPLKCIKKKDEAIVGSKAFRLSELLNRDLPVPKAFVLTTQAFDLFFEKNNLFYLLERLSTEDNRSILEDICHELKRKIKAGVFLKEVEKELKKEILKNKFEAMAVRSSATSEDLAFASFAGQFESYLNIKPERLFEFIKTCWASLYEERVISYTLYHQIPMHNIKMAVLIQEMIKAEKGGVIFTKDILRDNEGVVVIEAAKGLGMGVVAGITEPDRYIVEKRDLKTIGQKLKNQKPVLSSDEIFSLVSLGLLVENFYQTPQDIEWVIKDNTVFILQARPITT